MMHTKKSFSIIEMVIYTGVYIILMTVLAQLFISTLEVQRESQSSSSVSRDGKFILSRLSYDIRRATSIDTPSTPGSQDGTLELTIVGLPYTYSVSDGNLLLNGDRLNGYDTTVSDLNFIRLGNAGGKNSIQLDFTLTGNTVKASGTEVESFHTTVGLR